MKNFREFTDFPVSYFCAGDSLKGFFGIKPETQVRIICYLNLCFLNWSFKFYVNARLRAAHGLSADLKEEKITSAFFACIDAYAQQNAWHTISYSRYVT